MNKIVRSHYPVDRLPLDLREIIGEGKTVTITLEFEAAQQTRRSTAELFAAMKADRERLAISGAGDSAARIRALRDEWEE